MQYFNRELSWLDFNSRVLEEGHQSDVPLLERLRFLAIFCRNLDEFFMVRVAGKKRAVQEDLQPSDSPDDLPAPVVISKIREKVLTDIERLYQHFFDVIKPKLAEAGVTLLRAQDLEQQTLSELDAIFDESVFPILTPLAVDPSHPFPFLANLRVYLLVTFEVTDETKEHPAIGFVEIPSNLPRVILLKKEETSHQYVFVEDLIIRNLSKLFHGLKVENVFQVRVTRDLDFTLLENEVVDLLQSIQTKVRTSEQADIVRLELSENMPPSLVKFLTSTLELDESEVYRIHGPLALHEIEHLCNLHLSSLRYDPFNPRISKSLQQNRSIFSILADEDLLVHHPFESFYTVIEFIASAANDPKVLAIKQTLYRISGNDSPIIDALIHAAEQGKQVTAIVELKARFDEKNNIVWARRMERSGVNVVYGFVGLKTHAKATLIVRQEENQLRRYVHLGTGNYNWTTARFYSDISFFSADPVLANDIASMFNLVTGFNVFSNLDIRALSELPKLKKVYLAPLNLREAFIGLIEAETEAARAGRPAKIIAKANALVDRDIIDKLYEASQAGVVIKLIIRGICCLQPGVKGLSETIEVRSIIDRFLEHSRIYYFYADGAERIYLSSADWMPRNLNRRVELAFPIENPALKKRIHDDILQTYLDDNCRAQLLLPSGEYVRVKVSTDEQPRIRSQMRFIELAREQGVKSIPYEKAVRFPILDDGRPFVKQRPGGGTKLKKGKKK